MIEKSESSVVEYEVELKFPVEDLDALSSRLEELGAEQQPTVRQTDAYFSHPSRDFGETDEALRIRVVGDERRITYKGPRVGSTSKTRPEIELPLGDTPEAGDQWMHLLEALGFQLVAEVRKTRTPWRLTHGGGEVEVACDEVEGLGSYIELEIQAIESQVGPASLRVGDLARLLGLSSPEQRSYLEMLLP
ncbi:MAG: class IV adenylate cyclase [Planctomycetota bacterium]